MEKVVSLDFFLDENDNCTHGLTQKGKECLTTTFHSLAPFPPVLNFPLQLILHRSTFMQKFQKTLKRKRRDRIDCVHKLF